MLLVDGYGYQGLPEFSAKKLTVIQSEKELKETLAILG